MTYRIVQNDKSRESWFWHEPIKQWIEMEAPYSTIEHLTEMMRKGRKCECILDHIVYEINQKYA